MNMKATEYEGSAYVGVVGPETEIGECRDSIERIQLRPGDEGPVYIRATKGYEARQMHLDRMMASQHDWLLLLDHDQVFPADTLERLRGHKLPYVSGYYLRRSYAPIAPVWYERSGPGQMPMKPWTRDPERGKLHLLGASGWGCLLVHRAVIEGVQSLLKGEREIIEDDMDIYPYDLECVMGVIKRLEELAVMDLPAYNLQLGLRDCTSILREEIKPLRVKKDSVGSDIRFPFYARLAGFDLYGDPDVRCGHILNYPLTPDDYSGLTDDQRKKLAETLETWQRTERDEIAALKARLA